MRKGVGYSTIPGTKVKKNKAAQWVGGGTVPYTVCGGWVQMELGL